MPRLSLYKPERGQDYKFIDRQISEMFQVGGTDVYLHKYLGPKDPTDPTGQANLGVTAIQDVVFLENRDRKYEPEIYQIRGLYNVQNIDFNLSQFGLFIDNDTLYMTVHINDFIKYIDRKPISGDVIELPHLKDQFALGDFDMALPRYYVIEDVGRASEGFSATWFPHLYRLKLKKLTGGQQYDDILKQNAVDANGDPIVGTTLEDLLSTRSKELQINDSILSEAEGDVKASGYETRQFYTLAVDETGKARINTADSADLDASIVSLTTTENGARPIRTGYTGYLVGDAVPSNGYALFGHGIQFPEMPGPDDFFLRTDFLPNRLFRFDATRWVKVEDGVRMTTTNEDPTRPISASNPSRQTLKTSFINNDQYIYNMAVGFDYVALAEGATTITTTINYATSVYVVLKLDTTEIAYIVADYPGIISNVSGKVRITLPVVSTVQQTIPYDGTWKVSLCNNRDAQRQSLSKALKYKPEADL